MNFSTVINIGQFKACIEHKSYVNNYDPIEESEYRVNEYVTYLFENALFLLVKENKNNIEANKLLHKYYGCYKQLRYINFEDELDNYEKQEIGSLSIPDYIDTTEKENIQVILKMLYNRLNNIILSKLVIYSREQLLKNIYANASILSYISLNSNYWNSNDIDINYMNLVAESLSLVNLTNKKATINFLGSEKKTLEYLIHLIMNSKEKFSEHNNDSEDSIIEVLLYTKLVIYILQLLNNISIIYESGSCISITNKQIIVSEPITIRLKEYFDIISEEKINLSSEEVNNIFKKFEEKRGYSPFLLEDYLFHSDEKFLETGTIATLIEEEAFILDLQIRTRQTKEAVLNLLSELSLKPIKSNDFFKHTFSSTNRLFRTPIIKIDNCYLVSYQMLMEASSYFRYRVLKNELNKTLDKKTISLVKEDFNEIGLITLKNKLLDAKINGETNFILNTHNKCKHIFENKKNLPQEIDCYFIRNNQLFIIELKNRDLQRSLFEVSKSVSKINKDLIKLTNLRNIILENKTIMEDVFQGSFDKIHIYLTHKYPHFLDGTFDTKHEISIMSFDEFLEQI